MNQYWTSYQAIDKMKQTVDRTTRKAFDGLCFCVKHHNINLEPDVLHGTIPYLRLKVNGEESSLHREEALELAKFIHRVFD